MPPISIAGKPQIVSPDNMAGSLLMVPLNEAPGTDWLRHLKLPADNITVEDTALRIPMTEVVRANVGTFLDRLDTAIAKANEVAAQEAERSRQALEQHRKHAKQEKENLTSDLDAWWDEKALVIHLASKDD